MNDTRVEASRANVIGRFVCVPATVVDTGSGTDLPRSTSMLTVLRGVPLIGDDLVAEVELPEVLRHGDEQFFAPGRLPEDPVDLGEVLG